MRLLPRSTNIVKVGKVASVIGDSSFLAAGAVVTSLCFVLWLLTLGNPDPDGVIALRTTAIMTAVLIFAHVLGRMLRRNRIINEEDYAPERYALITDELRRRGIFNTRRFIASHPDHVRYAMELIEKLGWFDVPAYRTKAYEFEALFYTSDTESARIKDELLHIVLDRGIADQDEARQLLAMMLATEAPLMSGAL